MHLGGFTGGMGSSGEASNSSSSMGADGFNYDGFDPAMDPELAMAIRVSTEEARAHEEARLKLSQEQQQTQQQPSSSGPVGGSSTETFSSPGLTTHSDLPQLVEDLDEDDEDALIQRALEMSMRDMMTLDSTSGEPIHQMR
jgi:26S proteasome regulatory subunit N10